ncbi:MAG: polysaccharide deacetylase family protein [Candidatus Cloacimonetes bacterium]|nr:polysaccharide deacetylase family protein [Candidatus Cloacimonadota bacterium]
MQTWLTKAPYTFSVLPRVAQDPPKAQRTFPGSARGALLFSADFELAWAYRYSKTCNDPLGMAQRTRDNFPALLKLFETYDIPVTWATVGHLFLRSCNRVDHDWMRRIPHFDDHWRFTSGDWFDHDPGTDWKRDPHWYAPDLLEAIFASPVDHEIGCHSFSHMDFSDRNCPPEVADDEIKACVETAREWGIELKSMVFPGGTYGNVEILKKHGFTNYRRKSQCVLHYPYIDEMGLVVSPSKGLGDNEFGWSHDYMIKNLCSHIDKAIKTRTCVHFWFHPDIDSWFLATIMPSLLRYAASRRESGDLWIATMADCADYMLKKD